MKPMLRSLLLGLAFAAVAVTALAADVSGTWAVDGTVYGNAVTYPCTLRQQGATLSGSARIQETDKPVTGTVEDKTVTWKFEVEYNGAPLELVFTGTLTSDKDMSGTIAVAGVSGEFTAKKQ
jgi:hypothetical protein